MDVRTSLLALATLLLGTLLLGAALGALVARWGLRAAAAPEGAALRAERDLLRARVGELEDRAGQERRLSAVLDPVAASLGRVEHQVATLERDRVAQYARLSEQLLAVQAGSEALRSETASLAGALRASSSRGSWGEVQLRRVVEHAGMLDRVDFAEQVPLTTRSGRAVRPDLVVTLPGGKHVVVDAKAPLAAFLRAGEAADDLGRRAQLTAHARALRGHVDALAAKEYASAVEDSPDVVVCFIPGEAFLAAACEADPTLLEHAMSRRVVLATPTTLLALLRTVALTWQQDAVAGNARELFTVGRELYERLGTLGGHTANLGRSLHRAVEDYNRFVGTLERRVLVSARRIRELDLADEELPAVGPLEDAVRPLTAPELLGDGDDGHGAGEGAVPIRRASRAAGGA
ncbi:DNA recombination protein RmuC [Kineococcus sp. R8]|uniref:DNA recombination protein RmuC n=1 Tax=Kineococcus siccus TaxID=2696567 RepID=UPI001413450C|nr:DNA recombination protein RmuC [Kineococcus siccus]NAZ81024.1 DNA recombination protein RmuC [Kineococcus siccus]